ncbi:MAG: hypothetical protein PHQ19_03140 [Candidatus Krumholzibacteria bacterium]|nr:hypothetical protein [Candidatus Krumholzibacteria bacterium]
MNPKRSIVPAALAAAVLVAQACAPARGSAVGVDPYELQAACGRLPFARVVPLDNGDSWGLIYADVYGKVYLKRATDRGWVREWEVTNLGAKVKKFFILDVEQDGVLDLVIATVAGRILIYRLDDYSNTWENIEDDFTSIEAIDVANIDSDPQVEFIFIADGTMYIVDSIDKRRQWISQRKFTATELIVANVDKDEQQEIILNTGIVIDAKFYQIDLEWDKPFGERLSVFDLNSDGIPEIIGEFSDYSLRIFDVYAQREVW